MISEVVKAKAASEVKKQTSKEISKENQKQFKNLDKPLNTSEITNKPLIREDRVEKMRNLDKPLNSEAGKKETSKADTGAKKIEDTNTRDIKKVERMEPQIVIEFKYPKGMDAAGKKEFNRQLKAQERGINSQTIAENMNNRAAFEKRKLETGTGRDVSDGKKAQDIARQKAMQSRIESNQKKGMSYSEAKNEAREWIKTQAALHNPDQIAGGNPGKVSRMGDANINSSIGSQWRTRVGKLSEGVADYAKGKTREELENTKMNVKLVAV